MKIICYDIISLVRKNPELRKCPSCHSELTMSEVDHSEASRGFYQQASQPVILTQLMVCPDCAWWAVREQRDDQELYDPPVEAFIVMDAAKKNAAKSEHRVKQLQNSPAPWEKVLHDKAYWANPETISSTDAIALFGSVQMLLPKRTAASRQGLLDRVKSVAPILFPILVIIGIAFFF